MTETGGSTVCGVATALGAAPSSAMPIAAARAQRRTAWNADRLIGSHDVQPTLVEEPAAVPVTDHRPGAFVHLRDDLSVLFVLRNELERDARGVVRVLNGGDRFDRRAVTGLPVVEGHAAPEVGAEQIVCGSIVGAIEKLIEASH